MTGKLIVISAPSGAGKTTIINELLSEVDNIIFSVSITTREKRKNEINGNDYFFVTKEEFNKMIDNDELLEWAMVHHNYYGTPKNFVNEKIKEGKIVLLDIDIQGGIQVRKKIENALFIFIMPPSIDELEKRLRLRKTETEEALQERLSNARKELKYQDKYDYVVINSEVDKAVQRIKQIIYITN